MFQDITTLLLNPPAYKDCIDLLVERYRGAGLDVIAGFEARGFFFGPQIALALGLPFVPLRKPKKLPGTHRTRCVRHDALRVCILSAAMPAHANKGLTHAHNNLASFLLLIRPHARSRPTTGAVISESYALEYGTDALELHVGAITEGQRVLLVDDLIATGGTLAAGARLVRRAGGVAVEACCIIELPELGVRPARVRAACCVVWRAVRA